MFILFTDPLILKLKTEAYTIQDAWSLDSHNPSEAELKTAAQLAQKGLLVLYADNEQGPQGNKQ